MVYKICERCKFRSLRTSVCRTCGHEEFIFVENAQKIGFKEKLSEQAQHLRTSVEKATAEALKAAKLRGRRA